MTGLAAAIVEAWQELRIHKLRVLLSLVGVGVAVCSLTTVVAVASIAQQSMVEQSERDGGRPATFAVYAYSDNGQSPPAEVIRRAFADTMDKFDIDYHSVVSDAQITGTARGQSRSVNIRVVDPMYGAMRRVTPTVGRWLTAADGRNLSPAIVVNSSFLNKFAISARSLPTTVVFRGDGAGDVTATIIGQIARDNSYGDDPVAYMLADSYQHWFGLRRPLTDVGFQLWVPPENSKQLGKAVRDELRSQLPGLQLQLGREDYAAYNDGDEFREVKLVVGGISALILGLGALSLLNIALVTIQQRIREIGIRRSFGATTGRVFFSVMMESVVATLVAGMIGVVAAVGIVNSPLVSNQIARNVTDVPPFPVSAAVLGLTASLAVGALAGLLPALIAVRVKIIDAIRF